MKLQGNPCWAVAEFAERRFQCTRRPTVVAICREPLSVCRFQELSRNPVSAGEFGSVVATKQEGKPWLQDERVNLQENKLKALCNGIQIRYVSAVVFVVMNLHALLSM
jgi:hypothetical protein